MYTPGIVEQTKTARQSLDGAHILRLTRAAAPHGSPGWTGDCLVEHPPLHRTTPPPTFSLLPHIYHHLPH